MKNFSVNQLLFAACLCLSLGNVWGQMPPGIILYQPSAIHLSYSGEASQMIIRWATKLPTNQSIVEYGSLGKYSSASMPVHSAVFQNRASGVQWNFTDGGPEKQNQTLHKVVLDNLVAGETYVYHVGDPEYGWSSKYTFTAMRSDEDFKTDPLKILAFCDMGDQHSLALGDLQEDVASNFYDTILHCGDLAYDLDKDNGQTGNDWMRDIEPLAAYVPYMVSPGNHESAYNFSHYREYFSMPMEEESQNMFYSFNVGPAHIISYNTEVFFWPKLFTLEHMERQYQWLKDDLAEANKNRDKQPWVMVMAHRPMYCVVASKQMTCDGEQEASRQGIPSGCADEHGNECKPSHSESYDELSADQPTFPMEEIFMNAGVDMMIFGHVHDYERFWPTYNHTVVNGTNVDFNRYIGPKAPVHITTGSGGNPEMILPEVPLIDPPGGRCYWDSPWCAFESGYYPQHGQSSDFTYSRISVYNATHMYFEQYSSIYKKVIDHIWIVKETSNYADAAKAQDHTDQVRNPHITMYNSKNTKMHRKGLF